MSSGTPRTEISTATSHPIDHGSRLVFISAGVIITKDRIALLKLARRIWNEYQVSLATEQRSAKLPIDLLTSTVTAFDKAQLRMRRGVMGSCPVLIVAANEATWNGKAYI